MARTTSPFRASAASLALLCALGAASGAACTASSTADSEGAAGDLGGGGTGGDPGTGGDGGGAGSGGDPGQPTSDGLPCVIEELVQSKCASCHGDPLGGNATVALRTAADFRAPSASDPTQTNGAISARRIQSASSPMPPSSPFATAGEVSAFETWVAAGMPDTVCADAGTEPPADSGAGGSGGAGGTGGSDSDASAPTDDPFAKAPVCTSGIYWFLFDLGSEFMHPGMACNACHSSKGKEQFTIVGTVYPTGHEPDNCNGTVADGVTVVATDANGAEAKITPNLAGTFRWTGALAAPWYVKVVSTKGEREMTAAPKHGDCNLCHTQAGNDGAPGRIVAP